MSLRVKGAQLVLFDMTYDLDFQEEAKINDHVKKFLLFPEFWNASENKISTNLKWKRKKFNKQNLSNVPDKKGIYAFVLVPSFNNFFTTMYLFYIGKTNRTLRQRFREYLNEKEGKGKPRKKVYKMLNQYDGYLYFVYSEINDENDVDKCEQCLLNTFVPHVNASIPKAKIKPELMYIYEGN